MMIAEQSVVWMWTILEKKWFFCAYKYEILVNRQNKLLHSWNHDDIAILLRIKRSHAHIWSKRISELQHIHRHKDGGGIASRAWLLFIRIQYIELVHNHSTDDYLQFFTTLCYGSGDSSISPCRFFIHCCCSC